MEKKANHRSTPAAWIKVWLLGYAGLHIGVGLALPWLVHTSLAAGYSGELASAFFDTATPPPEVRPVTLWLLGLFGPTIASWGVLLGALTLALLPQHPRRLAVAVGLALLVWMPLDSLLGVVNGVYSNVLLNGLAVAALLPPLVALLRMPVSSTNVMETRV